MSSIVNHPCAIPFGLHSFTCEELKDGVEKLPALGDETGTIGNIISWIPVIGAIIGAIYIYAGYKMYSEENAEEDQKKIGTAAIGRGVAAILCMGPLLMIADIAMTIARQAFSGEESSS